MKKNFISIAFASLLLSGCGVISFSSNEIATNYSGMLKVKILDYKIENSHTFKYKFQDLRTHEIYEAKANRYYYNSDDTVFVYINNGNINNMKLIQRSSKFKTFINPNHDKISPIGASSKPKVIIPEEEVIHF